MHLFIANSSWTYIHESVFEKYRPSYTLKNLKKQNMIRLGNHWAAKKMPDSIKCYEPSVDMPWYIKVPAGLRSYPSIQFHSEFNSKVVNHPPLLRTPYDYQERIVNEVLVGNTWLIWASTWSWKTTLICMLTSILKRNTLIVVQNLTQMTQMVDDVKMILWVTPTQVSGKKYSQKERSTWYSGITVCSIDSRDKVCTEDYWLVLLDEADCYLGSDDRREWVGNISSEYLYALTGTVKINHVEDKVFPIYYGKTTRLELIHETPTYKQVYSDFEYYLDDIGEFYKLKEALYTAEKRNELIVETTIKHLSWRKAIVFTEHIEHAKQLAQSFTNRWIRTYILIWEVSKDERERIRQEAKEYNGEVILVGSVKILGRGFDLPELSLAVLTTAEKFQSSCLQYVWRIVRKFPRKPQPIFIDIVDHLTNILNNQARHRVQTYKRNFPEWKVINY